MHVIRHDTPLTVHTAEDVLTLVRHGRARLAGLCDAGEPRIRHCEQRTRLPVRQEPNVQERAPRLQRIDVARGGAERQVRDVAARLVSNGAGEQTKERRKLAFLPPHRIDEADRVELGDRPADRARRFGEVASADPPLHAVRVHLTKRHRELVHRRRRADARCHRNRRWFVDLSRPR
jgi:hypothetical protein